jgi:hypothetical protein
MRIATIVLAVAMAILVGAGRAAAQEQPITCADWFAVQRWSGTLSFSGSGLQTFPDGGSYTTSHSGTVTFTTDKGTNICDINTVGPGNLGIWGWSAQSANVTQDVSIHDVSISLGTDDNNQSCEITTHYDIDHGTYSNRGAQINMSFNSATGGTYSLSAINFVDGVQVSSTGCGHSTVSTTSFLWGPATSFTPVPVPSNIGMLSGSQHLVDVIEFGNTNWTANWSATPYFSWDVLIKSNPDYAQWRPMAGRTENDLSEGLLGMIAYVVDKDTGEHVAGVSVDGWTFQLKDVSHEPGVAMNYPPKSKLVSPSPPDLDFKFVNDGIFPNVKVSEDGLTLEATPDPSTDADISVFMNSRDWGAWGTLNVQTTIAGQVVKAHFENEEATDILLPKRQDGSHIADNWKTEKDIPLETADSDDSESDPTGYQSCTGDGLTLYEEYRGFMENGKHIEGDPTKKDFFVQNVGGGDLKPGIRKFTALTGLNVHKDLLKDEMDGVQGTHLGDRLINFNHDQGAHEVDQHGVIIAVCTGTVGGLTTLTQTGVHGRPGLVTGICLESRGGGGAFDPRLLGSGNTHNGTITPTAAAQQYDIAVAHELSHSVGVDHHGEGDPGGTRFTLVGPNDPRNSTGQPAFLMEGQSGIVHLLREETGADIAPPMWAKLTQETSKACGQVSAIYGSQQFGSICSGFVNGALPLFTDLAFYVAKPQKQHSGNDQCIMRYFFANAYQSLANSANYYLSAAGTENVGTSLCTSPAGTGVNATSHKPQSRYGNAAAGRGSCANWVCVNDKYAPIPD